MTTITTHSIAEYIRLKDERNNTTMMRTNGQSFYLIGNKWVTQKQYDMLRPIVHYQKFNDKGIAIGSIFG